ncbi:hypothetical protein Nmel_007343 [Mimus melanotis]
MNWEIFGREFLWVFFQVW